MKNNQIDKVCTSTKIEIGTPLHDEVKKAIEEFLWKDAPDLKNKMPKKWCKNEDEIQVTFYPPSPSVGIPTHVESPVDDKFKCPPVYNKYSSDWDCKIYDSESTPLIREWIEEVKKQDKLRSETIDMFEDIKKQLTAFMGKHASLNTAIKEMPELEMYVPEHYLKRLAEETVKHKKVFPLKDDDDDEVTVDLEAITRAAIAHRITSSGE
jgi:hypothetical protein